jgi:hypothetical protein
MVPRLAVKSAQPINSWARDHSLDQIRKSRIVRQCRTPCIRSRDSRKLLALPLYISQFLGCDLSGRELGAFKKLLENSIMLWELHLILNRTDVCDRIDTVQSAFVAEETVYRNIGAPIDIDYSPWEKIPV